MGQEILNRGVKPHGTIWGATALLHKKYHKIVVKIHLDFIKAGAEVIGGFLPLLAVPFLEKYVTKSKYHTVVGDHEDLKKDLKKKHK